MSSTPTAEHRVTCSLCEAMCGLRVTTEGDRVVRIAGDHDDVWSRGHICPKGTAIGALHEDPDRLRRPLVRGPDGVHREVTWAQAWTECERLLRPVLETDGASALTVYVGNPVAHNLGLARYIGALIGMGQAMGMGAYYSPATVDQWPLNLVSAKLFGGMWNSPVPDLDRTDHLVVIGANPAASQGSMLSAPDIMGRLASIRDRGGRVVVVDPRRTRTAAKASEWVPVRPGTDAALLFAVLRELRELGAVRGGDGISGLDEVIALAEPFTPERVEAATGVSAPTVRRLARDLAEAEHPALYSRIGACTQEFGTLATWLVFVINAALGAIDRPGGMLFAKPVTWSPMFIKPPDQTGPGWETGRFHSRVGHHPEVLGQYAVTALAEEITTPGAGRIRALISVAGNPVVSSPGAADLDAALPELDAFIAVDNWLNATTRHADVVLPGLSPLEHPHADDLYWIYAIRSAFKWSDAVFPMGDRPDEWEILVRLGGAMLGTPVPDVDVAAMDDMYTHGMVQLLCESETGPLAGRDPIEAIAQLRGCGPERLVDLGLRLGPWGDLLGARHGLTLEEVRQHPDGLDLAPLEGGRLADTVTTPSGTVELAHPEFCDDVSRLLARLDELAHDDGLVLTSRRHLRSNNSWLHNVPALAKGRDRCTVLIHPDDAGARGVVDGAVVHVRTSAGQIEVAAEVSDEMMRGVVSLPHGWGHDLPGTRLTVAAERPGVNSNLLNGHAAIDVPSNTLAVNGVPCEVSPA